MRPAAEHPPPRGPEDVGKINRVLRVRLTLLFCLLLASLIALYAETPNRGPPLTLALGLLLIAAYGAATGYLAFRAGSRGGQVLSVAPHILREISVGVVLTDSAYRVVYANPAFARMLGRPVERVVGAATRDFVHPADRSALGREQERRSAGESTNYRIRLWGDTPSPVDVIITASPFFNKGRFEGTIGLIHDVSESVIARRQVAQARHLSGFLFDAFTHDLSNSLQGVIGRAHVAIALAKAGDPNSLKALAAAAGSAEHTARLLREVKQIALAERENWPQSETTVGALIDRAISGAELAPRAVVLADVEDRARVLALQSNDLGALALSKVIEEAAQHPSNPSLPATLTVEVRQGELGPSSTVVRVRGCSFPAPVDELNRILAAGTEQQEGEVQWRSGVKLVLAAAVAKPHGWSLTAYPEADGRGTVFELRMPSSAPTSGPSAPIARAAQRRGSAQTA